jgi:molybdopterin-guanine dinucleotide biosynthesis protein A
MPGFQGPLAGLLTGMTWALRHHPDAPHLLTAPCDTPFLPVDLVASLEHALAQSGSDIAVARDVERLHPAIGLWPVRLAPLLAKHLQSGGSRSIHGWLDKFQVCAVAFDADALRNLNTPRDHADAEAHFSKPIAEPEI